MKFLFTILLAFCGIAHAELYQLTVKGSPDKDDRPYISDQKGFCLHLIDVHSKDGLISGLFTVPDVFGEIETAMLVLADEKGQVIARSVLGSEILGKGSKDFEFFLGKSLIKNSYIQISHRDGDNLYVAKIIFSSFSVQNTAEQDAAAKP